MITLRISLSLHLNFVSTVPVPFSDICWYISFPAFKNSSVDEYKISEDFPISSLLVYPVILQIASFTSISILLTTSPIPTGAALKILWSFSSFSIRSNSDALFSLLICTCSSASFTAKGNLVICSLII